MKYWTKSILVIFLSCVSATFLLGTSSSVSSIQNSYLLGSESLELIKKAKSEKNKQPINKEEESNWSEEEKKRECTIFAALQASNTTFIEYFKAFFPKKTLVIVQHTHKLYDTQIPFYILFACLKIDC